MSATIRAAVDVPMVPFSPEQVSERKAAAVYYREAARNIRHAAAHGNAFAGSNVTEAVAQLCEAAASALDAKPKGSGS